jgi:hypothetical protein
MVPMSQSASTQKLDLGERGTRPGTRHAMCGRLTGTLGVGPSEHNCVGSDVSVSPNAARGGRLSGFDPSGYDSRRRVRVRAPSVGCCHGVNDEP